MSFCSMIRGWRQRGDEADADADADFDAYLVSFPKSGRTWLTVALGRALQQHFGLAGTNPLELREMGRLRTDVPHIRILHEDRPHRKRPEELATSKEQFRGSKVMFLARDPRDVVVSYYFQRAKREPARRILFFQRKRRETHAPFTGTLSEFLSVPVGGFDTLLRYYNIWAENRTVPAQFLLVRYEDMHAEPARELRKVLAFLGLKAVRDEVIADAVQYSSFDNMRKLEQRDALGSFKLRPADVNDADSYKVRRGKIGGYVDYLAPEEIEMLNGKMAAELSSFYGYSPCAGPSG